MAEAPEDGDVASGASGFVGALATNAKVAGSVRVASPTVAAGAWALAPMLWPWALTGGSVVVAVGVTLIAVAASAIPPIFGFVREKRHQADQDRIRNQETEMVATLHSYLAPCLELLAAVGTSSRPGEAMQGLQAAVTNSVRSICGPSESSVRAVLFEATGKTLRPINWSGGSCNSTRKFSKNSKDRAGVTAWKTAESGQPVLFEDLSKRAPSGYQRSPQSHYQTFLSCGVVGESGKVYGMLNVDGPSAGDLTAVDMKIIAVFARLLATAYDLRGTSATIATPQDGSTQ